jgi:hypothetical protein
LKAAIETAQPMLWVDIRGDDGQGQALVLMLETPGQALPVT